MSHKAKVYPKGMYVFTIAFYRPSTAYANTGDVHSTQRRQETQRKSINWFSFYIKRLLDLSHVLWVFYTWFSNDDANAMGLVLSKRCPRAEQPEGKEDMTKLKTVFIYHIEAETKWPPFSRRHFEMHFREWKCMNVD